jgi:hypothetical protein
VPNHRYVKPNPAGGWDILKEGHRRAIVHVDSRGKAVTRAKSMLAREGGGEVRIINSVGKVEDSTKVRHIRSRKPSAC